MRVVTLTRRIMVAGPDVGTPVAAGSPEFCDRGARGVAQEAIFWRAAGPPPVTGGEAGGTGARVAGSPIT
jgi:hypothetical protein